MAVTTGKILKYTVLPGFLPRVMALFTSGFGHLAYYIALVYSMVGLLPRDHPYLLGENVGRYGIRHAIAAAAHNLVFKRENIDQILIFFTVMIGLVLIFIQVILLMISATFYEPALAAHSNGEIFRNLFTNPNSITNSKGPEQDIAFILLDRVFGVSGIFDSCISAGTACTDTRGNPITNTTSSGFPFPFHIALHQLFKFYSMGILVVGSLVIIYFVISIIGETATTGTPFGKRFNKTWAPVRIILFFGMLIPLNNGGSAGTGLNGAQFVTLGVAKYGSNFATNAWGYFNTRLTAGNAVGLQQDIIATPNTPSSASLSQFMLTAKTCAFAEKAGHGKDIEPYIVRPKPRYGVDGELDNLRFISSDYRRALEYSQNGNITIRFGERGEGAVGAGTVDEYNDFSGNVFPFCGELVLETKDRGEPGSQIISERYFELLQQMWADTGVSQAAECVYTKHIADQNHDVNCAAYPDIAFFEQQNTKYDKLLTDIIKEGVDAQKGDDQKSINASTVTKNDDVEGELMKKGWAGAAIWYNRVAQMNGAITSSALNIPRAQKYPYTLEVALNERAKQNATITSDTKFSIRLADGQLIQLPQNRHATHKAVYKAHELWDAAQRQADPSASKSENIIINTINAVLGTSGLFEIRNNSNIHPLAQLTSIGKAMMETVVRNTGYAIAGIAGETILGVIDPFPAQLAGLAKSFFFTVVSATIGIAVILFYVLPFLPFIYSIFAVSGWVKSIFEAMVAMPLWALAHLKIDGEGVPGPGASNGYFLLLEIFLRPVLIVVGLVSTINIFAAMVTVLNTVFDLVVPNVAGNNLAFNSSESLITGETNLAFYRGPVDEFFFTAMYAIICYMMGLSVFKLIDLIPNSILRWMGVSVATFQENAGDPASALTSQVYRGSILVSNQVKGATQGDLAAIVSG